MRSGWSAWGVFSRANDHRLGRTELHVSPQQPLDHSDQRRLDHELLENLPLIDQSLQTHSFVPVKDILSGLRAHLVRDTQYGVFERIDHRGVERLLQARVTGLFYLLQMSRKYPSQHPRLIVGHHDDVPTLVNSNPRP